MGKYKLLEKAEFDALLMRQFTSMFRQMTLSPAASCMSFGVECSSGWFDIIYELCDDITTEISKYRTEFVFEAAQVKEKYGSMRFYYDFYCKAESISEEYDQCRSRISELVQAAEDKTYITCEECGEVGRIRDDIGWYRSLCDTHYNAYIEKQRKVYGT
jgi:RNase P subunit RPR2